MGVKLNFLIGIMTRRRPLAEISDFLRSLFNVTIDELDGTYCIEVPAGEITMNALSADETYRVEILDAPAAESTTQLKPSEVLSRGGES